MRREQTWLFLCALAAQFYLFGSYDASAEVMNIEVIERAGAIIADGSFIPDTDPNAHFDLPTLILSETALARTGQDLWWDVVIKVTVSTDMVGQGAMLAIDKVVLNETPYHWPGFGMSLGRGVGNDFAESTESDGLFFNELPAPVEETGFFADPPQYDEPQAPDQIEWFADPDNPDPNQAAPGVATGQAPFFWLALNLPASIFGGPEVGNDLTMGTFTLRQHVIIPEPKTWLLTTAGLALIVLGTRRL